MYQTTYYRSSRRSGHKKFLFMLISVGLLSFVGWNIFNQTSSFNWAKDQVLGIITPAPRPIVPEVLAAKLKPYLDQFQTNGWVIGLKIYDLKTQTSYEVNDASIFEAASLTKLPVLLTYYQQIQQGQLDLEQMVSVRADEVADYGTSVLQYQGSGTKYSLKDLLWYMANRSDNTAFQVLEDKLGDKVFQQNLHDWGFQTTDIIKGVTTPQEMVRIFDLIYNQRIVTGDLAKQMSDLLVASNDESRIPGSLPKSVRVTHKTGNAIGGLQDAGIVELPNHPYIIAVLTDNVDNEKTATDLIQKISRATFDYMASL